MYLTWTRFTLQEIFAGFINIDGFIDSSFILFKDSIIQTDLQYTTKFISEASSTANSSRPGNSPCMGNFTKSNIVKKIATSEDACVCSKGTSQLALFLGQVIYPIGFPAKLQYARDMLSQASISSR